MIAEFFAKMTPPDIVNAAIALLALVVGAVGLLLQWRSRAPRLRVATKRTDWWDHGTHDPLTGGFTGGRHRPALNVKMRNDGPRPIEVEGVRIRWLVGREREAKLIFSQSGFRIAPDESRDGLILLERIIPPARSWAERAFPLYRVALADTLGRRWRVGVFWLKVPLDAPQDEIRARTNDGR